jgi:hypothetical protein
LNVLKSLVWVVGGSAGFDGMGDVLRPGGAVVGAQAVTGAITGAQPTQTQQQTGKVLTGDLDSSLALLANNLSINKSAQQSVK